LKNAFYKGLYGLLGLYISDFAIANRIYKKFFWRSVLGIVDRAISGLPFTPEMILLHIFFSSAGYLGF
jgi:hypothetical protein